MKNKKYIFIGVIALAVVLIIALSVWLSAKIFRGEEDGSSASEYSAVYLLSGDLYYGKLSKFPSMRLSDVWYIQTDNSAEGAQIALQEFERVFWSPMDELKLNPKHVVWNTRLRKDSPLLEAFNNPERLQQAQNIPSAQQQSLPQFQPDAAMEQ